jgi:alkanesulfonate monooxygenase SsuD/methylene tetrahydromethanopterin reductase-like flavin-dependent oxidoreductase (luciferase family)
MSGGRVELGLGSGWYEGEHTAYGIPFPSTGERFERLEEQLAVVTGLWTTPLGERFTHEGTHYAVVDSPGLPKPVQRPRPPIVMGGVGKARTPRLAARFADEFNTPFVPVDRFREQRDRVRAACEEAGRDPATMTFSAAVVACVGKDEDEFRRRAGSIGRDPEELRSNGACGSVSEAVDRLAAYAEAGADRVYLQCLDLTDLDMLRLLAGDVAPSLR